MDMMERRNNRSVRHFIPSILFILSYSSVIEACGLWRGERWAEWLAAACGAIQGVYEILAGLPRLQYCG